LVFEFNSQRILQAHLKAPQINAKPKLSKELSKPTQKKNFRFFFQRFKKLKHPTQANDNDTQDQY